MVNNQTPVKTLYDNISAVSLLWSENSKKNFSTLIMFLLVLLISAITIIVYFAGGTSQVWPHLYYVAIILSAYFYPPLGGAVAGLLCGLIVGPYMPLSVEPWVAQKAFSWVFRLIFFVASGTLSGLLIYRIRSKATQLEQSAAELKSVNIKLDSVHEQILRALILSIDARDHYTRYHSDRVARYAMIMGRYMGLPQREILFLGWAGLLHDLGKIGIPEDILQKNSRLSDQERSIIQQHAELSARIIRPIKEFRPIIDGVLYHHERMDGSGYPNSLPGSEIPPQARIIMVADVYEALTADRPYRKAWSRDEALRFINENSGSQFDKDVVAALSQTYQKFSTHPEEGYVGGIALREILMQG